MTLYEFPSLLGLIAAHVVVFFPYSPGGPESYGAEIKESAGSGTSWRFPVSGGLAPHPSPLLCHHSFSDSDPSVLLLRGPCGDIVSPRGQSLLRSLICPTMQGNIFTGSEDWGVGIFGDHYSALL